MKRKTDINGVEINRIICLAQQVSAHPSQNLGAYNRFRVVHWIKSHSSTLAVFQNIANCLHKHIFLAS